MRLRMSAIVAVGLLSVMDAWADEPASTGESGGIDWSWDALLMFEQSRLNEGFIKDNDDSPGGFRRADFSLEAGLGEHWTAVITTRLNEDLESPEIKDAFVTYRGLEFAQFTIGRSKDPFGLENATSSRYLSTLERSAVTEGFAGSKGYGIKAYTRKKRQNWALGFYDLGIDSDETGRRISARYTRAPWHEKEQVIHLGLGAQHLNDLTENYQIKAGPEFDFSRNFVRSQSYSADSVSTLGVEAAWVYRQFSMQSEWVAQAVNLTDPSDSGTNRLNFTGGYVLASVFLTGESRPYKKGGRFGRVKPARRSGAFELAARYTFLDLHDDGSGMKAASTSVGINYYLNKKARAMLHYARASQSGSDDDPRADGVSLRLQLEF